MLASGDGRDEDDFFAFGEGVCPVGEVSVHGNHHALAFEGELVFGADFLEEAGGSFAIGLNGFG